MKNLIGSSSDRRIENNNATSIHRKRIQFCKWCNQYGHKQGGKNCGFYSKRSIEVIYIAPIRPVIKKHKIIEHVITEPEEDILVDEDHLMESDTEIIILPIENNLEKEEDDSVIENEVDDDGVGKWISYNIDDELEASIDGIPHPATLGQFGVRNIGPTLFSDLYFK